jgi:hypothetical protein
VRGAGLNRGGFRALAVNLLVEAEQARQLAHGAWLRSPTAAATTDLTGYRLAPQPAAPRAEPRVYATECGEIKHARAGHCSAATITMINPPARLRAPASPWVLKPGALPLLYSTACNRIRIHKKM